MIDPPTVSPRVATKFIVRGDESRCEIAVVGDLDISTAGALADALDGALEVADRVVVDLASTGFADWRGVRPLVDGSSRDGLARRVQVRNPPRSLKRIAAVDEALASALRDLTSVDCAGAEP